MKLSVSRIMIRTLKVHPRTVLAFAHDVLASPLAWITAFWLRFNLEMPAPFDVLMLQSLWYVIPLQAGIFLLFGLYRGIWRYASIPDLKRIVLAVLVAALALPALFVMLQIPVPRSVLILDPILLAMIMGGSRVAYRVWKEQGLSALTAGEREPVVILGAGEAAVTLLKELSRSAQWQAAGVFDDNTALAGRQLQGVRIFGEISALPGLRERLGVRTCDHRDAHGVARRTPACRENLHRCRTQGDDRAIL